MRRKNHTNGAIEPTTKPRHHVLVGGLGNIGTHTVSQLARLEKVSAVTLVDRDVYQSRDLRSQDIRGRDVGKTKASVQARRLREIRRDLRVTEIAADLADVPLGTLKADLMLSCLDSLASRRVLNQAAFRLGATLVDAGVRPDQSLARVTVYVPGDDFPCMECAWDSSHYDDLDQRPCARGSSEGSRTGGPAFLGAIAAAFQVAEVERLLTGGPVENLAGRQVVVDVRHDGFAVSRHVRNPHCRMSHQRLRLQRLGAPKTTTFTNLIDRARDDFGGAEPVSVAVVGRALVRRVVCEVCGRRSDPMLRFSRRGAAERRCRVCRGRRFAVGSETDYALDIRAAPGELFDRSLGSIGVRPTDVVTVSSATSKRHYEIGENK